MEGPGKAALSHPLPPLPDRVVGCRGALGALGHGHFVGFLGEPEALTDAVQHVRLSQQPFPWKERVENMKIKAKIYIMSLCFLEKMT